MAHTWQSLVRKWQRRILRDPGWEIEMVAVPAKQGRALSVETKDYQYRKAQIIYPHDSQPDNAVACHEVIHIALAGLSATATVATRVLGGDTHTKLAEEWIVSEEERAVETLTRALVAAYAEEDKDG